MNKIPSSVVVCACCQQGYSACTCRAFVAWSPCIGKIDSVSSWHRSRTAQEREYLANLLEREGA